MITETNKRIARAMETAMATVSNDCFSGGSFNMSLSSYVMENVLNLASPKLLFQWQV